jgi:hypothetical protein
MSSIHFQTTYSLSHQYHAIKSRAPAILGDFLADTTVYHFNDLDRTLTFTSERLIPEVASGRQRILLLFSNPHPHSIQQGMFLSPSVKGGLSLFWSAMQDAGWFRLPEEKPDPQRLAEIFLRLEYESPFELLFYCYYAFPTRYPEHIQKLFGKDFFKEVIEPEASQAFSRIIQNEQPAAVVTFNKSIFNLASTEPVGKYIARLKHGDVIQNVLHGTEKKVPVFVTYPTGWRYDSDYKNLRRKSLERVKDSVLSVEDLVLSVED